MLQKKQMIEEEQTLNRKASIGDDLEGLRLIKTGPGELCRWLDLAFADYIFYTILG